MRTTLKRGYGRAVEPAGNGQPVLPPTAPSPITRYASPLPPHRSAWRTAAAILGWFVVCVLVLVLLPAVVILLVFVLLIRADNDGLLERLLRRALALLRPAGPGRWRWQEEN